MRPFRWQLLKSNAGRWRRIPNPAVNNCPHTSSSWSSANGSTLVFVTSWDYPWEKSRQLPSKSFPFHHSSIILPFDTIQSSYWQLSLCIMPWRYTSTVLDLGIRWRWVVRFTARPHTRLGVPQNRFGRCGEEKNLDPAENLTSAVQPLSHRYTQSAIPTPA
jgi:hypothetical protein